MLDNASSENFDNDFRKKRPLAAGSTKNIANQIQVEWINMPVQLHLTDSEVINIVLRTEESDKEDNSEHS